MTSSVGRLAAQEAFIEKFKKPSRISTSDEHVAIRYYMIALSLTSHISYAILFIFMHPYLHAMLVIV